MKITCEVTPNDHVYVSDEVEKAAGEQLKDIKLIGLFFVGGITLLISNMFFEYENDPRFWYIGLPISLLSTLFAYLYICSGSHKKKLIRSTKEQTMRGHFGRNTFTIEANGLRETNERGEHFTKWKFIDDIQVHVDCTLVRTGVLFYTIPNRTEVKGTYEPFVDELSKKWKQNKG